MNDTMQTTTTDTEFTLAGYKFRWALETQKDGTRGPLKHVWKWNAHYWELYMQDMIGPTLADVQHAMSYKLTDRARH